MATGFFGKLPVAGDFVARGLAPGLRAVLDRWLTLHFSPLVQDPVGWPEGGVRGLLRTAQGTWILLIEPGFDAVGRTYPLVACTAHGGAGRAEADRWADAVWPHLLAAIERGTGPDELMITLAGAADPAPGLDIPPIPSLWWAGVTPTYPEEHLPLLARISSG
ncbi:type VI secretion system-associated protein TagF [Puniceibacterium sp. IMCC21224]|uniref:type VI secretion system-associated protein TagF n=1 Tax=Puniceibacterium sp. IMCC21224 TaxID=1618204 RepID=UPI00065DA270|nr:type VI secretion system-associated protein TagF [Puniceibacterium sp. IMCC21224]KMK65226.1 type VI secretion-associated protein, BMA_A0400 family [Puniceibacterium sp. IMCC21224]